MSGNAMPFSVDKVQQFVVQFAHRVPVRRQLTAGEKKALENLLKDLDQESFQLFEDPTAQNPACLLQVLCQHPVDAAQITLPSFVLSNDSFTFVYPVRILGKYVSGRHSLDTSSQNAKMRDWSFKVQEAITNLRCQRAGKIYELVFGPFNPAQKPQVFAHLFSNSVNLSETGEVHLDFAYYRQRDDAIFNVKTVVAYLQQKLDNDFLLNVRVDINNRQLRQSMDPAEVEGVWKRADQIIWEHLEHTLAIG